MKTNFVVKNVILFIAVVVIFFGVALIVHCLRLDHEVIQTKQNELSHINENFENTLDEKIKGQFASVTFMANTSYPSVALDFEMYDQFYDVFSRFRFDKDLKGVLLVDERGKIVSRHIEDNSVLSKIQSLPINKTSELDIIFSNDQELVFFSPILSENEHKGFVGGIKRKSDVLRTIYASYREETRGALILHPDISIHIPDGINEHVTVNFSKEYPSLFGSEIQKKDILLLLAFGLSILTISAVVLRKSLKSPFKILNNIITFYARSNKMPYNGVMPDDPLFFQVAESMIHVHEQRKNMEALEREREMALQLNQAAQQVAHDIRSPLAALEMAVKQADDLPEEKRLLIRSAVQRIRDIANNLSRKKNGTVLAKDVMRESDSVSVELLSGLVDAIVSEKRLQYRDRFGVAIECELDASSYGLFAAVQPVEFKRVLSNLINNAVEALPDRGRVSVRLSGGEAVRIEVRDNGTGIAPEILPKLMQRGVTHGKTGGSGLGLFHARTSVEQWGGRIEITSHVGDGTTVAVTLPKAPSPSWFAAKIDLVENATVVVIDDDESIHQIWKQRFEAYRTKCGIRLMHFSAPNAFSDWHNSLGDRERRASMLYLCDYEFLNHDRSGLDVIQELKIAATTLLVTSRYEDADVRQRCDTFGVRLVPKNLAGFVPLHVVTSSAVENSEARPEAVEPIDAVLIDDDDLVHLNWQIAAKRKNKIVRVFTGPEEFWKNASGFSKDTPIYVDASLGDGIKGEDVSWMLGKKGYSNLYLATGYDAARFEAMPWLKDIVGKDPPWE